MYTVELLIDGDWKRTEQEWTSESEAREVAKEVDSNIKDHISSTTSYTILQNNNAWTILCQKGEERYEVDVKNLKRWVIPMDYTGVRIAEVTTSISINKKSWHYRFNKKLREMGSEKPLPASLCPYFWLTVRNVVGSTLFGVMLILFTWAIGDKFAISLGLIGIPGVFTAFGFGLLMITCCVLVIGVVFGVVILLDNMWTKFKDYRAGKRIEKLAEIKLKKPDSMLTEVKRSFKDKVCPHITFKE
jgi:hypothetical protein